MNIAAVEATTDAPVEKPPSLLEQRRIENEERAKESAAKEVASAPVLKAEEAPTTKKVYTDFSTSTFKAKKPFGLWAKEKVEPKYNVVNLEQPQINVTVKPTPGYDPANNWSR